MGWAWDLKRVNPELIAARVKSNISGGEATEKEFRLKDGGKPLSAKQEWTSGLFTISQPLLVILAIKIIFSNKIVLKFFNYN